MTPNLLLPKTPTFRFLSTFHSSPKLFKVCLYFFFPYTSHKMKAQIFPWLTWKTQKSHLGIDFLETLGHLTNVKVIVWVFSVDTLETLLSQWVTKGLNNPFENNSYEGVLSKQWWIWNFGPLTLAYRAANGRFQYIGLILFLEESYYSSYGRKANKVEWQNFTSGRNLNRVHSSLFYIKKLNHN